jgi:hypothetical protein
VPLRRADEQPVGDAKSVLGGQRLEDLRDVISSKQVARDSAVVLDDRDMRGIVKSCGSAPLDDHAAAS